MIKTKVDAIEMLISEQNLLLVKMEYALEAANASKLQRPGEPVKADDTPQIKSAIEQIKVKIERMEKMRTEYLKVAGVLSV